jgi:hypothetical protein
MSSPWIELCGARLVYVETENDRLKAEIERLRAALIQIVEEKCDYMRINNLGDPETQHTVKAARAALNDH